MKQSEATMNPKEFLQAIEADTRSFTEGRRNDDVVNWALTKMMVANDEGTKISKEGLMKDFNALSENFEYYQKQGIDFWDDDVKEKLERCYDLYHFLNNRNLKPLLIDQGGYGKTAALPCDIVIK